MPLERGHAFTLTGWEAWPGGRGAEAWISELLDAPSAGELVIYADPGRGAFRYVSLCDGRLQACLFLARDKAALPPQEALAALLGTAVAQEMRTPLLAGNPAGAAAAGDPGRAVCACFAVGLRTLVHSGAQGDPGRCPYEQQHGCLTGRPSSGGCAANGSTEGSA